MPDRFAESAREDLPRRAPSADCPLAGATIGSVALAKISELFTPESRAEAHKLRELEKKLVGEDRRDLEKQRSEQVAEMVAPKPDGIVDPAAKADLHERIARIEAWAQEIAGEPCEIHISRGTGRDARALGGSQNAILIERGLLALLDVDGGSEVVRGMLAHEIGHLKNDHDLCESVLERIPGLSERVRVQSQLMTAPGDRAQVGDPHPEVTLLRWLHEFEADRFAADRGLGREVIRYLEFAGAPQYEGVPGSGHPPFSIRKAEIERPAAMRGDSAEAGDGQ